VPPAPAAAAAGLSRARAGPSAHALLGDLGELTGADVAAAIVFWRGQVAVARAARDAAYVAADNLRAAADQQLYSCNAQLAAMVGDLVEPLDAPRVKRAKRGKAPADGGAPGGSGKGKGKARAEDGDEDLQPSDEDREDDDAEWGGADSQ
jgi:hypothetical protein